MLQREYIQELKQKGNGGIGHFLRNYKDANSITFILENLGHLPKNFDGSFLLDLIKHKNSNVRLWVVKTLGKIKDSKYLSILKEIAISETETTIRREAVSSIGRYRSCEMKEFLIDLLGDLDPKIISQVIRGLLVFKGDNKVDERLKELVNHPNEMIRNVIYKEYFSNPICLGEHPHIHSYDNLKNIVIHGDTLETMKVIKDESIHLTFTSPPYYNARDYSIYPSYKDYLNFLANVFKEVNRITKEGRFLILNTSPIIIPRISRSHSSKRYPIPFDIHHYLIEMGWDFIDDIIWMKPEASVKNRIGGFQQHRKPLGYKPNSITEYLMVYRKSTDKLLDWNMRQYDWDTVKQSKVDDGFETNNVWKIDPCFDKVHSAVFPVELCKRVIQYYSFKGDLVFDPFGGSGTVGRTAKSLGRYFLLTEKDEKYFEYMKSKKTPDIFDKYETKFYSFDQFIKTQNDTN